MGDRGPRADGHFAVGGYISQADPKDANSPQVESVFEDFTSYKNRNSGIWARGEMHLYKNLKMADNAIGFTHASGNSGRSAYTSRMVDSLFVGETENIGNPTTPEEKAYGRSLPKPMMPDFPIRGFEYYDARHDVVNTTFRNFEDNATRKTGALSYLLYTSFGVSSNNAIDHVKFIKAKPVYFPPMQGNARWASDNGNSQAYKTAAIRDKDGSLGAGPNAYVLINDGVNDSIATDTKACQIKRTWNAAVCKGDVGRLNFAGPPRFGGPGPAAGGGPGAVAGGPGAAPAGAGGPGAPAGPGPGGPGGAPARGGFGAAPAQPPVVLSRNGRDYPIIVGGSNVRAGTEIKVTTERTTLPLRLSELDKGSWVIFELPGFTTAASGTEQTSLDALRKASDTSYYKDKDALWVKLVSPDSGPLGLGGGTTLEVSR